MKKQTSLTNSSMQDLLLLHWAAVPLPTPGLFRPPTLWSRSWRLICWQLLWLEGPAPTLPPRHLQYECERVNALTWMRAFSNMQGSFFFLQSPFVVDPLHLSKMSVAQKTYVALVWGRVSELVSSPCLPPSPRCWAICVLSSEGGDKILGFYSIKAVLSQLCSEIMIHRSEAAICLQSNGGHFWFWGKMNRQQSWQWRCFKGQKVHSVGQYVGGLFTHTGDVNAVIR